MLEDLEMPVNSEVAYLDVLLNLNFQSTSKCKYFQSPTASVPPATIGFGFSRIVSAEIVSHKQGHKMTYFIFLV